MMVSKQATVASFVEAAPPGEVGRKASRLCVGGQYADFRSCPTSSLVCTRSMSLAISKSY